MTRSLAVVGKSLTRLGALEKVTGRSQYTGDLTLPGMLHAKILRSPHPHARIVSIDTCAAQALPGVAAVVTPRDVAPDTRLQPDLAVLDWTARFVGDEVAAVAAVREEVAEAALDLIQVEYELLPTFFDPMQAMKPDAFSIHPGGNIAGGKPIVLERGSVEEGFAQAERTFEGTYTTQVHCAAGMEPRVALAQWDGDFLTVWKSSRGIHMLDRPALARGLGIPAQQVRVICPAMGGGFGSKDETRMGTLTALLARKCGKPVRMEYTRQEEFVAGRTRHPSITHLKVGIGRNGEITAIHARTIMSKGAYMSSGSAVIRRCGQGALYLYQTPNAKFEGTLVYTNVPPAGSYRALGAPQGQFALEVHMDKIAEALGLNPLEFRRRHHVKPEGQPGRRLTPPGELVSDQPVEGGIPFSSNRLSECVRLGSRAMGWQRRWRPPNSSPGPKKRGLGMALGLYRGGLAQKAGAEVEARLDGSVEIRVGTIDVGEGAFTTLLQIGAEALEIEPARVTILGGDTATTPEAPVTSGSSTTFSMGTAVQQAAATLKERILDRVCAQLGADRENVKWNKGAIQMNRPTKKTVAWKQALALLSPEERRVRLAIQPGSTEFVINSFAAHFAEVEVDTETGKVAVVKYVAAHDSGRIVNPAAAQNQVEGGVMQMLGYALTEELLVDPKTGIPLNGNFLEHKVPVIVDLPPLKTIFVNAPDPAGPFGAKALGEPPSIPVAPAISNAIYNAIGIRFQDLPITPGKILDQLPLKGRG